ncbi:V-type ATP synthase subunit D [Spirochaeta thermophila]|uniref:V-type ATPase, subunit D n=1 Tax=Winmispira thermophila (strain ATCC 49972 / DSM 6192 / RI 19.B1) TaxID=665571 RepID=E0RT09_WINT6|nr:V-type ATP synthase subunit D [Spirochaeta thermophila]ADN02146.1 V-type ATPase, subunit D [Spirochaeta thermophila DSM 6192]
MAKIKLTKNELKRQKDALKRYERYLPTLQLKKQQLQLVITQVEARVAEAWNRKQALLEGVSAWRRLFGEDVRLENLVKVREVRTGETNIAGVDIPTFEGVDWEPPAYDLYVLPVWVDDAVLFLRELLAVEAEIMVLEEQKRRLSEELRITSQRVNLFEKVKIPETRDHIRRITIYLGDQQTAAVVRGKIAKKKLEARA